MARNIYKRGHIIATLATLTDPRQCWADVTYEECNAVIGSLMEFSEFPRHLSLAENDIMFGNAHAHQYTIYQRLDEERSVSLIK